MDQKIHSRFIERTNVPDRNLAGHGIRSTLPMPRRNSKRTQASIDLVGTDKAFLIFHRPKACALIGSLI